MRRIHPWSEAPDGVRPAAFRGMDEIERIATVLGTLASWTVWVIGLGVLGAMAALPLLESFAQSRVDGKCR
ncbi:hypothetical protein EV378_4036 [Pseudonocardia endophytica]|uniref:Uncharacterized protein n=1 Tax=Pseudonocardia endophytica TaxID=401976 RepID=A0A4R1HDF4_PSEEN|nr:hypothetical protein EV378_4036 [Pseudonocardia endophytica]